MLKKGKKYVCKGKGSKMTELKMGDIVDVDFGGSTYEKRKFIEKSGRYYACIPVNGEGGFFKVFFEENEVHPISWRPFTFEERENLYYKWIRNKKSKTEYNILAIAQTIAGEGLTMIRDFDDNCYSPSFKQLLEKYEYIDGSPCGIEVR